MASSRWQHVLQQAGSVTQVLGGLQEASPQDLPWSVLRAAAHLELACVHQHHRHVSKAKDHLAQAAEQLGTSLYVTGKLHVPLLAPDAGC